MGELQADSYQLWLYVILGVIYVISRLFKKPKQESDFPDYNPEGPVPQHKNQPGRVDTTSQKELTFEELLREITEGKVEKKVERPAVPAVPHTSYEDVSAEEEQDLEVIGEDYSKDDRVVAAYEEAKRQAFLRPSLEETLKLKDTEMKFGKFKAFELEGKTNLVELYLSDLKDPQGLKKAVVMSEILQRKF